MPNERGQKEIIE